MTRLRKRLTKKFNMYCSECGVQIADNSKFCQHCGTKQVEVVTSIEEKVADVITDNVTEHQVTESPKSSEKYHFIKKHMGWYLAWVVLHFGILLIFSDGIFTKGYMTDDFYPFVSRYEGIGEYDIREFLVYSLFPLAILFIMGLAQHPDNTMENNR